MTATDFWTGLKKIGAILGLVATCVSIITGVYRYLAEKETRLNQLHATAWSLVSLNRDRNAGLNWALELLAKDQVDMKSLHFIRVDLSRINLESAKLSRLLFEWSNFYQANLKKADLSYANFWCSDLENADFSGANLDGVDFSSANISNANFRNTNTTKSQLSKGCITKKANGEYRLPHTNYKTKPNDFLICKEPENGIQQCLEKR